MDTAQLTEMSEQIEYCNRKANLVKNTLELIDYRLTDHRSMGDLFSAVDDITKRCTDIQQTLNHLQRKMKYKRERGGSL